jgi:hypothetical protein
VTQNGGVSIVNQLHMWELVARLGVPTFVLVVGLFFLVPRIDRGIEIADRVDAKLQILANTCSPMFDPDPR